VSKKFPLFFTLAKVAARHPFAAIRFLCRSSKNRAVKKGPREPREPPKSGCVLVSVQGFRAGDIDVYLVVDYEIADQTFPYKMILAMDDIDWKMTIAENVDTVLDKQCKNYAHSFDAEDEALVELVQEFFGPRMQYSGNPKYFFDYIRMCHFCDSSIRINCTLVSTQIDFLEKTMTLC
jgi:hypothetical protein